MVTVSSFASGKVEEADSVLSKIDDHTGIVVVGFALLKIVDRIVQAVTADLERVACHKVWMCMGYRMTEVVAGSQAMVASVIQVVADCPPELDCSNQALVVVDTENHKD